MRRFLVPTVIYLILVVLHLAFSSSSIRVQAVSFAILALAFLAPALVATHIQSWLYRLVVCAFFAVAAMLLWDATAHLLIAKAEPFFILRETPVIYIIGLAGLVLLSYSVAWLGEPPNHSFKRTAASKYE